jgi:O-antigen/teichoic acid export membrane protein
MSDIDELKRRSISGVVSYGLRTAVLYVIAVVATGLLGIYLDPAEFGVYYVVLSVIGIFTFLSDVGLAAALIQKKTEPTIEDLRTTFTVQQILAFTIFALAIGLTPLWRRWTFLDTEGLKLLYALAFSFVLASFKTIPSILLERKLEFNKLVIPQIVEQVLFYTIAVYLAAKGYGVASFTLAVLVRSISGVGVIYLIQSWPIGFALVKKSLAELLHFGVKFQANDFLARLKDDLFIVVLAKFIPAHEMGYLGWAKRWSMFPYQFSVNNVVAITFPTYSRLQEHTDLLKRAVEKSLYFIGLVIFPILAGMSIMAFPLTILIPEYEKWQPAVPLLYFFCINIAFAAIANPIINTLNAIGKISWTLRIMTVMTAMTWVATPVAYLLVGINGVAMVSAMVAGISLISYWWLRQVVSLNIWPQLWGSLAATILLIGFLIAGYEFWSWSWLWFGTGIFVGGGVYVLTIVLVQRQKLISELKSLRKR